MQKKIFLFLDYDGTLTPIVKKPGLARLSSSRRKILKKLAGDKNIEIAVVSGRILKNVKSKVGISNIHYVGNHGFEIDNWVHPKARSARKNISLILNEFKKRTKNIKGVIIENKKYTASIHYRLVSTRPHGREMKSDLDLVFEVFKEITRPLLRQNKIKISYGKKVFELRPPAVWDKGKAVLKLLKKNYFPIYIGDDATDEDAFLALKDLGLTIFVGDKKKTLAKRHFSSVKEVYQFLNSLLKRNLFCD